MHLFPFSLLFLNNFNRLKVFLHVRKLPSIQNSSADFPLIFLSAFRPPFSMAGWSAR